jgi:DNA-binding CsgD family transcriptional regulator
LLLGQLQRKRRQKISTAATLTEALRAFEDMSSPVCTERARAELERANVTTSYSGFTPSERRVAELAISGVTAAQVAADLFVSVKTAEANLTRISQVRHSLAG